MVTIARTFIKVISISLTPLLSKREKVYEALSESCCGGLLGNELSVEAEYKKMRESSNEYKYVSLFWREIWILDEMSIYHEGF